MRLDQACSSVMRQLGERCIEPASGRRGRWKVVHAKWVFSHFLSLQVRGPSMEYGDGVNWSTRCTV
jgi:hypothetical protein